MRVLDEVSCVATMRKTSVQLTRASAGRARSGFVRFLPLGFAPILLQAEARFAHASQHHVLVAGAPWQEFVHFHVEAFVSRHVVSRRRFGRPSSRHVLEHVVGARISIETHRGDGGTWRTQDRAVRRGRHAHAAAEGGRCLYVGVLAGAAKGGGRGHRRRIGCGEDRRAAGRQCGARLRLRVFGERADGAQGRQAAGQAELAHAPRRSEASSADQLHLALRRRLGHPHQARDVRGVSKRDVERVAHRQELQPRRTRRVRSVRQGCARACQDGASAPTEVPRLRLDVFHRWTNQLRCVPTWMGQNLLLEVLGRVRRNPLLRGQDVSGRERLRNLRLGTDPWTHRDVARRHRRPSQRNLLVINGRSQ
mmetsp:Transcript_2252/g.14942  ORF Transcript_2252/g.14942 Transcript_2252/m.14942 type:complete len:365 (+) Transcript_2252:436-1530(+)